MSDNPDLTTLEPYKHRTVKQVTWECGKLKLDREFEQKLFEAYGERVVQREIARASLWLATNKRRYQLYNRFLVRWLNRTTAPEPSSAVEVDSADKRRRISALRTARERSAYRAGQAIDRVNDKLIDKK